MAREKRADKSDGKTGRTDEGRLQGQGEQAGGGERQSSLSGQVSKPGTWRTISY